MPVGQEVGGFLLKICIRHMERERHIPPIVKCLVSGQFCNCKKDFNLPIEKDGKLYCFNCEKEILKLQNFR